MICTSFFDIIEDDTSLDDVMKLSPVEEIENNWCYSIKSKEFIRLKDFYSFDKEQFDDIFAGKIPVKKPSAFAIGKSKMKKVIMPTYHPAQKIFFFEEGM